MPGKPIQSNFAEENNYIFRVRSQESRERTCRAMYGKIIGDFDFSPGDGKTATIRFAYYLNPDYSMNLEFDRNRNLFHEISELEKPDLQ